MWNASIDELFSCKFLFPLSHVVGHCNCYSSAIYWLVFQEVNLSYNWINNKVLENNPPKKSALIGLKSCFY